MNYLPSCDLIVFVLWVLCIIDAPAGKVPLPRLSAVHRHQEWSGSFNKNSKKRGLTLRICAPASCLRGCCYYMEPLRAGLGVVVPPK